MCYTIQHQVQGLILRMARQRLRLRWHICNGSRSWQKSVRRLWVWLVLVSLTGTQRLVSLTGSQRLVSCRLLVVVVVGAVAVAVAVVAVVVVVAAQADSENTPEWLEALAGMADLTWEARASQIRISATFQLPCSSMFQPGSSRFQPGSSHVI
jgi:hypothetical protein